MKANSTLRSDSLLIRIAASLLKPILRILVWIAKGREKTKPDACTEQSSLPAYGLRLFNFLVFGDQLVAVIEDHQEHYQKIFSKNGKDAADQWFYKELPETLSLLILRSEPWVCALHSIRRRSFHLLSHRRFHKQLSSLLISASALRARVSTACVGLLVLVFIAALLAPDFNQRQVDEAEDRSNKPSTPLQENPSSNPNEVSDPEPLIRSPQTKQKNPSETQATADQLSARIKSSTQLVTLKFPQITRELVPVQVVKASPKRTRFYISLPWGNEHGPYKMRVTTQSFKTLVSHQVSVRNGKFTVVFDLQKLKPGFYRLEVNNEVESHVCQLEILRTGNDGR